MKKGFYFICLICIWLIIVLLLATLFVVAGLSKTPDCYGFYAKLGGACANPQIYVFALGVTLLLRSLIYLMLFKVHKKFAKDEAILCIIISILWVIFGLAATAASENASQEVLKEYSLNK